MSRNPFAAFQLGRVANRTSLIESHLKELAQHRTQFSFITDLADAVAVHVGEVEGASCHKTTLLRNKTYKALLLQYMEQHCKGAIRPAKLLSDTRTGFAVTQAELEAANLRREVERLKLYIANQERKFDHQTRQPSLAPPSSASACDKSIAFALTCKSLALVLSNLEHVLILSDKGEILDLSKRESQQVVVDAKTATPFVAWMKSESVEPVS